MEMDGSLALRSSRCPTIAPSRGRIGPSGRAGNSYFDKDRLYFRLHEYVLTKYVSQLLDVLASACGLGNSNFPAMISSA